MISELLPKPYYRHFNGKSVRTWTRADVTEAEQSPRFIAADALLRIKQETENAPHYLIPKLRLSMPPPFSATPGDAAEKPDGDALQLARRYHEAILEQIPSVPWADKIKPGQAVSYIEHFLALSSDKPGGQAVGEAQALYHGGCLDGPKHLVRRDAEAPLLDTRQPSCPSRGAPRPSLLPPSRRLSWQGFWLCRNSP